MTSFETGLYELAHLFLLPVLILIAAALAYAFWMLGLVATMLPMGPALLALTRDDAKTMGENLVVAFSAVVLALISASIAFLILTIRRRWLLQDLRAIERGQGGL